ncbi:MAG: WG repeat-containing protein [Lewinella sp.]|nr:WG repeat-containing protein [Lewinella sp.]
MFKSFPFFLALFLAPVFPSLAQDELPAVYPFAHHGEWGLIDANRQVILEPSLAYIQLFRAPTEANALTIATEDGRKGLLRRDGEWAFRPLADSIGYPQQAMPQLHWATLDDRYGLVTTAGQPEAWLIHPQFTEVNDFEGNKISLAVVATAEGRGVVNQEGEFVAPCIYDEVIIVDRFSDYPNLRLIKDGEVTYLDAHGMPREPDQEVQAMASWETAVAAQ